MAGRPIGLAADHTYLCIKVKDGCWKDVNAKNECGLARYQSTWKQLRHIAVEYTMAQFHTPRGSHTRIVSHCMTQPQMLFLTQHAMQPILVVIQNGWYDEECHDTRSHLQREATRGICTHKQARITFQCLVKKKISYFRGFSISIFVSFLLLRNNTMDSSKGWV